MSLRNMGKKLKYLKTTNQTYSQMTDNKKRIIQILRNDNQKNNETTKLRENEKYQ